MAIDWGQTFKNATPITPNAPPTPGFFSSVGKGITQGLKNSVTVPYQLAKGIFTGFGNMGREVVSSGVRSLQAIPDTVQQIGADIKGDKVAAQEHAAASGAILQAPINDTPTFAGSSVSQNLGSATQWTSFLVPGTKLGTIAQASLAGALNQGGAAATDPNATGTSIAQNTIEGGALGAATAGLVEQGSNLLSKPVSPTETPIENLVSHPVEPADRVQVDKIKADIAAGKPMEPLRVTPEGDKMGVLDGHHRLVAAQESGLKTVPTMLDKPSPRLADVIPDYKQVLKNEGVSGYVKNTEGKMVPRVNEGQGLVGDTQRSITPSQSEIASAKQVDKIQNYPEKGTALQKAQSVHDEITTKATGLESKLAAEDKARPLNSKAQEIVTKNVLDKMTRDARETVITRGTGGEAVANERAGSTVGRYAQDVADKLNEYDGTRKGILTLRKNLDAVYEDARGKSAFGSEHRNNLDEMHTQIRDYLNKELGESTTSTDTQASLKEQTNLFRAHKVLTDKAEAEATSYYGRLVQQHPALKMTSRILARQGIMVPLRILEALAGVTAATAAARKIFKK